MPRTLEDTLAWQADAACSGMPLDAFFPVSGHAPEAVQAVCSRCPVRLRCLAYGSDQSDSVWGGLSRSRVEDRVKAWAELRAEEDRRRTEEANALRG